MRKGEPVIASSTVSTSAPRCRRRAHEGDAVCGGHATKYLHIKRPRRLIGRVARICEEALEPTGSNKVQVPEWKRTGLIAMVDSAGQMQEIARFQRDPVAADNSGH
jgi:hypothetical protein